jgi:hypothetical protein
MTLELCRECRGERGHDDYDREWIPCHVCNGDGILWAGTAITKDKAPLLSGPPILSPSLELREMAVEKARSVCLEYRAKIQKLVNAEQNVYNEEFNLRTFHTRNPALFTFRPYRIKAVPEWAYFGEMYHSDEVLGVHPNGTITVLRHNREYAEFISNHFWKPSPSSYMFYICITFVN